MFRSPHKIVRKQQVNETPSLKLPTQLLLPSKINSGEMTPVFRSRLGNDLADIPRFNEN